MRSLINTSLASLAIAGLLGTTQAVAQEISTPETATPFASEQVLTWDEDGNPTSGVISFDVETAIIKPRTTENVGGGTWTYDVTHDSTGAKICSSKYMHKTKTHTATAIMGGRTQTVSAKPGHWANASVTGGVFAGRCNAYWSTQ